MKKVFWSILGGIALLGVGITILGYALGGGMGTMHVADSRLVYYSYRDSETYDIAAAPRWMQRLGNRDWESQWDDVWASLDDDLNSMESSIDEAIEKWEQKWEQKWAEKWNDSWDDDDYDDWTYDYYNDLELDGILEGHTTMPDYNLNGVAEVLPFASQQDVSLTIDLGFGYVTIVEGDTASIQADGPLGYKVTGNAHDGYKIKPQGSLKNVTTEQVDGYTHYFRNGNDITTFYTITLPRNLYELNVEMTMGMMELRVPTLQTLEVENTMASINVLEANADYVELECTMGNTYFEGRVNNYLEANCSMGNIDVKLPRSDYSYNVASAMGVVSVDGELQRNNASYSNGSDGTYLYLDCSMGNISVLYN